MHVMVHYLVIYMIPTCLMAAFCLLSVEARVTYAPVFMSFAADKNKTVVNLFWLIHRDLLSIALAEREWKSIFNC